MNDFEPPRMARFVCAPSGSGKTFWSKHSGLALDGDDVIHHVLGWRYVRGRLIIGQGIDLDIDATKRAQMARVLWDFSAETQTVIAFNGALLAFPPEHGRFAFVEPQRHAAVRWLAARDKLTTQDAARRFDRNIEANRQMCAELRGRTFSSFDAASRWLDDEFLAVRAAYTGRLAKLLRKPE
jgi:hypothetical protein